jgi:DNA repair photolyase
MTQDLLSLPLFAFDTEQEAFAPQGELPAHQGSIKAVWIERQGSLLHPTPLGEKGEVLSVNLTRGCMHRCAFCSVRAAPNYSGQLPLQIYSETPDRLAQELASRRHKPRAVYISPSTDPFPPHLDLQTETIRVVRVLAGFGVQAWLMTRGFIRPAMMDALSALREHVKITVGMTTLDRRLQRALEPLTASPRLRLRQIGQLRERGINVQVAIEPLIPGLTDTRDNLDAVLDALSDLGIRQVSASYLFLRPAIRDNLVEALLQNGLADTVTEAFAAGPLLNSPGLAAARYLPRGRRQHGYAALMALAAARGISVGITAMTNPDFPSARAPLPEPTSRQRLLPLFLEQTRRPQTCVPH